MSSFIRVSLILVAISFPALALPAPYRVNPSGKPYVGITPGRRHRPSATPVKRTRPSPILAARGVHVASLRLARGVQPTPHAGNRVPTRPRPSLEHRQLQPQATPVIINMILSDGLPAPASSEPAPSATSSLPPVSFALQPAGVPMSKVPLETPTPTPFPTEAVIAPIAHTEPVVHHPQMDSGGPSLHKDKVAAIAAILSVIVGLIVLISIVKLTHNAIRRHKYPLGRYTERLGSEDGLIPKGEMRENKHDFVVTGPDGAQTSPTLSASGDDNSMSPPHFTLRRVMVTDPPRFALPTPPIAPVPLQYAQLLSPTVNLAQQNLAPHRASTTSGTLTASTTGTDVSSDNTATSGPPRDSERASERTHRRMRSAPVSIAWSTRQSSTLSAAGGEEGYWDTLDVCGRPESTMTGRSSRTKSMDVTGGKW